MTTLVTFGASPHARSMWRGSPLHYELVLTLEDGNGLEPGMVECLREVVHEEQRRAREKDRRPVIETNGVWAPGYAPHLVFAATSAASNLMTRKKCGSAIASIVADRLCGSIPIITTRPVSPIRPPALASPV